MDSRPGTRRQSCQIDEVGGCVRGRVGRGHAAEVERCYEDWASACAARQPSCALLVGDSDGDPFVHLAARGAVASLALAGMPGAFRLALVALNAPLIAVYDAVVVEALRQGIEARRFGSEREAGRWLAEPGQPPKAA